MFFFLKNKEQFSSIVIHRTAHVGKLATNWARLSSVMRETPRGEVVPELG
jgi:hypothetical protein